MIFDGAIGSLRGFSWFLLDSFVRNERFQWVASDLAAKKFCRPLYQIEQSRSVKLRPATSNDGNNGSVLELMTPVVADVLVFCKELSQPYRGYCRKRNGQRDAALVLTVLMRYCQRAGQKIRKKEVSTCLPPLSPAESPNHSRQTDSPRTDDPLLV